MIAMSEDIPHLLTPREIAERERLSIDSVKRALRNKRLQGRKVGSRGDSRISAHQYQLWIDEGAPTSPRKAPPPQPTKQPPEAPQD